MNKEDTSSSNTMIESVFVSFACDDFDMRIQSSYNCCDSRCLAVAESSTVVNENAKVSGNFGSRASTLLGVEVIGESDDDIEVVSDVIEVSSDVVAVDVDG